MKKFTKKSLAILFALALVNSSFTACSLSSSKTTSSKTDESADASASWTPVKWIDFSSKHDVMIKNEDGSLIPMDQPYFQSKLVAPGTWQILSDGDYMYLVEGDNEAIMIDSGYGAGNIREYAQSLTSKPIKYVINTHYHFDHTANDAYFDCAYMSPDSVDKATIPYPSFEGIDFPRNYPIVTVKEGYKFDLGNRELEVFDIPNHTVGGIALLDRRERILFSGDEIMKTDSATLNCSVAQFENNMSKLEAHRSEFDKICGGPGVVDATAVDNLDATAKYILSGQGTPQKKQPYTGPGPAQASTGDSTQKVYVRHQVRSDDAGEKPSEDNLVQMTYNNCTLTYDSSKIN